MERETGAQLMRRLMGDMDIPEFAAKTGLPTGTIAPIINGHVGLGVLTIRRLVQALPERREEILEYFFGTEEAA